MGIPRFFSWLRHQRYPNVLQEAMPDRVDWLIFDTNSLFHQAHQQAYSYGEYFDLGRAEKIRTMTPEAVEADFRRILIGLVTGEALRVNPRSGILIAVDGVAPLAKIQQQRQRRYRSARTSDKDAAEQIPDDQVDLRRPIVDPNRITPGTEFMFRLDQYLRSWLETPANAEMLGVETIIYSSHLVPGEGEHKYLDLVRNGTIPSTGVHVIHGMDADLLILGMLTGVDRVYVSRDDAEYVVSLHDFHLAIASKMGPTFSTLDFAVLTFLLGNDFFPHQPALLDLPAAMETLMTTYSRLGLSLTQNNRLNWNAMSQYLRRLADQEPNLIGTIATTEFTHPSIPMRHAMSVTSTREAITNITEGAIALRSQQARHDSRVVDYGVFRDYWYQHALGPRGPTQVLDRLLGRSFGQVTLDRVADQAIAYLQGLSWNVAYYSQGGLTSSWVYVYPYHHAPLLTDIADVATNTMIRSSLDDRAYARDGDLSFTPIDQLVAVMPFESRDLLPEEVRPLMGVSSPIYDLFPNQFLIDREATTHRWEGVGIIPTVEADRILDAVGAIPFPDGRWERYADDVELSVTVRSEAVQMVQRQRDQMKKVQAAFPSNRGGNRGHRGRGRGGYEPRGGRGRGGYEARTHAPAPQSTTIPTWRDPRLL